MASPEDQVGQSTEVVIPAGELISLEDSAQPSSIAGETVAVVLVDVSIDMEENLAPYNPAAHPLEMLHTFDTDAPLKVPMTQELVKAAWGWVQDPGFGERAAFYSATEEEAVPTTPTQSVPNGPKAKAASGTPSAARKEQPKKPRPTVATLAGNLEALTSALLCQA